jgi:urease accessory protein
MLAPAPELAMTGPETFASPRLGPALLPRSAPAHLWIERVREQSVVRASFARSPLRLLTPGNHGRAAWVYATTLGGGLVDGDELRLDVAVGEDAACVLSSQGETRVYRSPHGCSHELRARVQNRALLAVVPDPTVCFAGARYCQRTEIHLAPTAALAFADVLLAGRTAQGERWAFERFAAELTVRLGERVVIGETLLLDPVHGPIGQRFGRFDAFGTLLLVGEPLRAAREHLREELQSSPAPARANCLESASALGEGALLVRVAAVSAEDVVHRIRAYLDFLPALLGDDPWTRRN